MLYEVITQFSFEVGRRGAEQAQLMNVSVEDSVDFAEGKGAGQLVEVDAGKVDIAVEGTVTGNGIAQTDVRDDQRAAEGIDDGPAGGTQRAVGVITSYSIHYTKLYEQ